MDPVTVSASILGILALAQNLQKIISAVTKIQDPRVDQIYYRLLAEKKRTEGWASQMRVLNSTDLRATIPPEEFDEVVVLLGKLDTYYKQAEQKFSGIERSKEGPIDLPFLNARIKFLAGGYDGLKDFVDTLAAMNKALKSIAPPLPMYSPGAYRDRSPIRFSSSMTADDASLPAQPSPASEIIAQDFDEANTVDEPMATQSVHSVYQTTLDSLVVLSVRLRNAQIARSASRLKVWGAGLFKMSVPLDEVFKGDKDGYQLLRRCILEVLVEILVWEEQELNILASKAENKERFYYQQSAQATTALLGTDELMDLALESWSNLLVRQANEETSSTGFKTGGDLVPGLVQILFDLLPALRAARQIYCINLAEARVHPETTAEDQADVLVASSSVEPSSDNVESKLDAVDEILSKRDNIATKKGKGVIMYSPIFRKERERLREFYTSQSNQSSSTNRDRKQLEWKQTQLVQSLSDYIKNSAIKSDTRLLEDRKPRMRSKTSRDKDKKISNQQEEEGRVDEIIDYLRDTTTDMWSISGIR